MPWKKKEKVLQQNTMNTSSVIFWGNEIFSTSRIALKSSDSGLPVWEMCSSWVLLLIPDSVVDSRDTAWKKITNSDRQFSIVRSLQDLWKYDKYLQQNWPGSRAFDWSRLVLMLSANFFAKPTTSSSLPIFWTKALKVKTKHSYALVHFRQDTKYSVSCMCGWI